MLKRVAMIINQSCVQDMFVIGVARLFNEAFLGSFIYAAKTKKTKNKQMFNYLLQKIRS